MNKATSSLLNLLLLAAAKADKTGEVMEAMYEALEAVADPTASDSVASLAYDAMSLMDDLEDDALATE